LPGLSRARHAPGIRPNPQKTRGVAPAGGCLLCQADRLIHATFTNTTVLNIDGALAAYRFTPIFPVAGAFAYTLASKVNWTGQRFMDTRERV